MDLFQQLSALEKQLGELAALYDAVPGIDAYRAEVEAMKGFGSQCREISSDPNQRWAVGSGERPGGEVQEV